MIPPSHLSPCYRVVKSWDYEEKRTLYHAILTLLKKAFENNMEKGEKCLLPAYSPFPSMFSIQSHREIIISATFTLSSASVLSFGEELNANQKYRRFTYCLHEQFLWTEDLEEC